MLAAVAGPLALAPCPASARAADLAGAQQRAALDLDRLREAHERDPASVKATLEYVRALIRASRDESARPLLYTLLQNPASLQPAEAAEAFFHMGGVHLQAGEDYEAVACWRTVLRDYRASERASSAAINAAVVLFRGLNDAGQAFNLLTECTRDGTIKSPQTELANFLIFEIYVDRRSYTEARGLLGSLPTGSEHYGAIRNLVPVVYWKTGDEAKARVLVDARFEEVKDDLIGLNNLAAVLAEHGLDLDRALACAERALRLSDGRRHYVWDTYADLLFRTGQIAKAIDAEEKAVALATSERVRHEYRARLQTYRAAAIGKRRPTSEVQHE